MPREQRAKPRLMSNQPTFKPGYWAAIVLRDRISPSDCYVGEVQAVDEHGVRLTLVDWIVGAATGSDLFVAWEHIATSLVAAEQHDLSLFLQEAGNFQTRVHQRTKEAGQEETGNVAEKTSL